MCGICVSNIKLSPSDNRRLTVLTKKLLKRYYEIFIPYSTYILVNKCVPPVKYPVPKTMDASSPFIKTHKNKPVCICKFTSRFKIYWWSCGHFVVAYWGRK
jgi:hypothetical protein